LDKPNFCGHCCNFHVGSIHKKELDDCKNKCDDIMDESTNEGPALSSSE
jgi:hypothetical protein